MQLGFYRVRTYDRRQCVENDTTEQKSKYLIQNACNCVPRRQLVGIQSHMMSRCILDPRMPSVYPFVYPNDS